MKNTAKIKLKNRIRKLLSDKRGFSLGELLAATVILLLASQVMTQGMAFATRMYKESLTRSHAKQLCSTLTNVIEKELRYTTSVATVYKGNIIKNLIMDCQSYTKYRPNETTGGIFVSWRRKEELPTGA